MAHLVNPLATAAQLYRQSPLPSELQEVVHMTTQCLTQSAGLLLELPQSVTAQACVVLARYWLVESPLADEFSDVSAAALYLVAKMGPVPRSPRSVFNVYAYLVSTQSPFFRPRPDTSPDSMEYQSESDYFSFQKRLLALEARILRALAFNTHVSLPHALAITYLQTLDFLGRPADQRREVSLRVVQHLNTALLSPQLLYLTHQPHALATAAVYCAARDVGAKMPECPWWEVFDVDREELGFLVVGLLSVETTLARRKEDMDWLGRTGMVTRKQVVKEMARRTADAENVDAAAKEEQLRTR